MAEAADAQWEAEQEAEYTRRAEQKKIQDELHGRKYEPPPRPKKFTRAAGPTGATGVTVTATGK